MSGSGKVVNIQILHVPGCPRVDPVRETVHRVLAKLKIQAEVEELVSEYPSPTLFIDGRDITDRTHVDYNACRLDLPTGQQVLVALRRIRDD